MKIQHLGALLLIVSGCSTVDIGARPKASVVTPETHGAVGRTFAAQSHRFEACARDAVSIQTGTPQTMELEFVVEKDGQVSRPQILKMSAPDPDLYQCVLEQLAKLRFPAPKDRLPKQVQFPLILKPE